MAFWGRFFWSPFHPYKIWQFLTSSYYHSILYHILIIYLLTNCKLLWWGKIFNAYKKDKIPPCDDVVTWYVVCCYRQNVHDYMVCDLLLLVIICIWLRAMWIVVLNANFPHFYQLHPYPSPRPGKCCYLKKRRKIALSHCFIWKCDIYRMIMRVNLILQS